jgi:hypothetical protein
MEFIFTRTGPSKPDDPKYVEINDIQDLIKFIEKYGDIVIQKPEPHGNYTIPREWTIEVYDAYRE